MSERDYVADVVEYYEKKLATYGSTPQGVDWKDEASQIKRFEQLARALDLGAHSNDCSILDFGCGYGAVLPFLRGRGIECAYVGYDRSPLMIAEASRLHEGVAGARFTSDLDDAGRAGYVIASGIMNVRLDAPLDQWREYVFRTLQTLDERATLGWAANFLTFYSDEDRKRNDLYYADPREIFDWCKRHASRSVVLLHDYALWEFTIGVIRNAR